MCIGGGSAARPCACMRKASATASTYSSNGTRAARSSRDRTIRGRAVTTGAATTEAVVLSMRNHLDERALRRAWTENRLAGACVSLSPKAIPIGAAQQEPGAMRAWRFEHIICGMVDASVPLRARAEPSPRFHAGAPPGAGAECDRQDRAIRDQSRDSDEGETDKPRLRRVD